jgi:hypothetical protein
MAERQGCRSWESGHGIVTCAPYPETISIQNVLPLTNTTFLQMGMLLGSIRGRGLSFSQQLPGGCFSRLWGLSHYSTAEVLADESQKSPCSFEYSPRAQLIKIIRKRGIDLLHDPLVNKACPLPLPHNSFIHSLHVSVLGAHTLYNILSVCS